MSGNSLVVEQAAPLAPPTEHAAQDDLDAGFVDLDAGDSLLDSKPDDGKDTTGEEPKPEPEAKEPQEAATEPSETGDESEDDEDIAALRAEPEKPAKLSGSARLKAKLAEAQAEIERLRQAVPKADDASELSAAITREIGPPPKESDFEDYLAFQEAKTAYRTAEMLVGRELKKNAEAAKAAQQQQSNEIVATFRERAEGVRKIVKDFDAVIGAATVSPTNQEVAMAILESEKGPHIAYYLSKHPEKVIEINEMPTRRALAEVGRLEARLTPAPKKESKAPAPVAPVRGSTRTEAPDPEKMSMDQFAAWYDKQKASRG
jgi:hypothetical protein